MCYLYYFHVAVQSNRLQNITISRPSKMLQWFEEKKQHELPILSGGVTMHTSVRVHSLANEMQRNRKSGCLNIHLSSNPNFFQGKAKQLIKYDQCIWKGI